MPFFGAHANHVSPVGAPLACALSGYPCEPRIPPVGAPLVGAPSWSPCESRIAPYGHPSWVPFPGAQTNLESPRRGTPCVCPCGSTQISGHRNPNAPHSRNSNTKTAQNCHQNANLSMLQCDSMNDPGMNSLQQRTDTRKDTIAPLTRRPHHPPGRPPKPVLTFGTVVCSSIASVDSSAATQFGIRPRRGAADAKCAPQQEPEYGNHLTQPDMNPTFPAMTRLFQTRPDMNRPNPPIHVKGHPKDTVIDAFLPLRSPKEAAGPGNRSPKQANLCKIAPLNLAEQKI